MNRTRNPQFRCLVAIGAMLLVAGAATAGSPMNTDQDITNAVENEMLLDGAVTLNDIDVSTEDGIVSLTGEVENILEKERAARIATIVRGVESVVNRIDVSPLPVQTDSVVEAGVENALLADPATDAYQIDASVNNGIVTLTGTVDSWREKKLAEQVAKGQDGVQGLDSSIDVDYETDRPDAEVRTEIVESLEWNALVDDGLIDVQVNDGKVTLSGTVGSAAEKQETYGEAWVAGVSDVDMDGLQVARWARDDDLREDKYADKTPAEIEEALDEAFLYDPRVNSFEIAANVDGGIATLRGTVDNLKAKRAAERTAEYTVGVDSVHNLIRVRPEDELEDAVVEQEIAEAIDRNPYVNRHDVTVNVIGGTAYLYGEVDSFFERGEADDLASRTDGVTQVENHLTVADEGEPFYTNPYLSPWTSYDYEWDDYTPRKTMKADAEIKEDIESQIFWSPFVDSDDVEVTVDDGEAELNGTVESWSERSAATENAFDGGAAWVDNDLVVQ